MDAIEWIRKRLTDLGAYALGRPDLKQKVTDLKTNLTHEQRRSTELDQRARDAKTHYDNSLHSLREAAADLEASSREREEALEQRVTDVEGEREVAVGAWSRERKRNVGLRGQVADLTPKARALETAEKQATDARNLVGLLKTALERHHPEDFLFNEVFGQIRVPLLWLDKYHRIARVSAGFTKTFGYDAPDLQIPLAREEQNHTRGIKFVNLLSDPKTFGRFTELTDVLFPETDQYHIEVQLGMRPQGKKSDVVYIAKMKIANRELPNGDSDYQGAVIYFEKPSWFRKTAETLLSFLPSGLSYINAGQTVNVEAVEVWISDIMGKIINEDTDQLIKHPVLIDFSNTEAFEDGAPKKLFGLYRSLRQQAKKGYQGPIAYLVLSSLRGQLFDEGIPAHAMLLPKSKEPKYRPIILPGGAALGTA